MFLGGICGAQNSTVLKQAERYFKDGNYLLAHGQYSALKDLRKDKKALLYKAIAGYHIQDFDASRADLQYLINKGYKKSEVYLYLGRIAHVQHDFVTAASEYKKCLGKMKTGDKERSKVIAMIKRCSAGINAAYIPQIGYVENLGAEVNSPGDEIRAIQSPNYAERYYFSSSRPGSTGGKRNSEGLEDLNFGKHFMDMYVMNSENGIWKNVEPVNALLNSPKHEIIHDFSAEGSVMFYSRGLDKNKAAVMVDTFSDNRMDDLEYVPLMSKVVGELGDAFVQVVNDTIQIFSSKRKGGQGGYDLYITKQKINGEWTEPMSLGENLNSPYNEKTPYLAQNNRRIYFSSDRIGSIGGFDVFYSDYNASTQQWSDPKNIGLPVNTASDELHYRMSYDGKTAMFSSNRKEGQGGYDLYISYMLNQVKEQVMSPASLSFYFEESMSPDTKPTETFVDAIETADEPEAQVVKTRDFIFEPLFYSNDTDLLTPQNSQKLKNLVDLLKIYPEVLVELVSNTSDEGDNAYELYFSVKRAEKIMDYLVSQGVNKKQIIARGLGNNYPYAKGPSIGGNKSLADRLNKRIDINFYNYEESPVTIKYERPTLADYLKDKRATKYSDENVGLIYRVQIAKVNQMYQNEILKYYTDVVVEKLSQGGYLYTIGNFKDFAAANQLMQNLKANGYPESTVNVYVDGVRIPKENVQTMSSDHPDLINFLKFGN